MAELVQLKSASPREDESQLLNQSISPTAGTSESGEVNSEQVQATKDVDGDIPPTESAPPPPPPPLRAELDQPATLGDVYATIPECTLDPTVTPLPSHQQQKFAVSENQKKDLEFPDTYTQAEKSQFIEKCVSQRDKRGSYKNIIVLCIIFLLIVTAFVNIQTLQELITYNITLHSVSFIIIHASAIISCVLLTPFVIQKLGCKKTTAVAIVPYVLFITAHFYTSWATLIPTSLLLGVGSSLLWPSALTYLSETAVVLAEHSGKEHGSKVAAVLGVFYTSVFLGHVCANLITAVILKPSPPGGDTTVSPPYDPPSLCGVTDCSISSNGPNTTHPLPFDFIQVYSLCGTFVCMSALAVVTVVYLLSRLETSPTTKPWQHSRSDLTDPGLPPPAEKPTHSQLTRRQHCCGVVSQTLKQWRNKKQLLLIPVTLYCGLEQAFFINVFSKAFVSCTLGEWRISHIALCCGATAVILSPLFGWLVKFKGKLPIFIIGAVLHIGVLITMFLWIPHSGDALLFFVLATVWGAGEAVWLPQTAAVYGAVFPRTRVAGFTNFHLWQAVGALVSSLSAFFLCPIVKLSLLLVALVIGLAGCIAVEMLERSKRRNYNVRERTLSCDDTGV